MAHIYTHAVNIQKACRQTVIVKKIYAWFYLQKLFNF